MKDYIPLVIIVGLASIGMISIVVDIIIGSFADEGNIIVKNKLVANIEKATESDIKESSSIDYNDDLIINE